MDYAAAVQKRNTLQMELDEINKHPIRQEFLILPDLLEKEINRLNEDINTISTDSSDNRFPLEGESLMRKIPTDFGLSRVEATEKFIQNINSDMERLQKLNSSVSLTFEFFKRVLDHTETYLKKQRLHQFTDFGPDIVPHPNLVMVYKSAIEMRNRLQKELDLIKSFGSTSTVNLPYLLKFLHAEVTRLDEDISKGLYALENFKLEIRVPAGAWQLYRVPAEYGLSCTADTENFIRKLYSELQKLFNFPDLLPFSFQLIHRVIGYAEVYLKAKRPFENAVFNHQEARAVKGHPLQMPLGTSVTNATDLV